MIGSHRRCLTALFILAALGRAIPAGTQAAAPPAPSGVWLGQDGHDVVGPSARPGGNGVQDAHIALSNLPSGRRIASAVLHGYGGGEWLFNGPGNSWRLEVHQPAGANTADLYFEPGQAETGRNWELTLRFEDGSSLFVPVPGGRWDPGRRMPEVALQARWAGQDGPDLTGPEPAVGPDGCRDAHIILTHLYPGDEVQSVTVRAGTSAWEYGLNPQGFSNAELVRRKDDRTQADLYFSPDRDLAGQTLAVSLVYAQGSPDAATVEAGACNPHLRIPAPAPISLLPNRITARWLGQDGGATRGWTHIRLTGLPAGREVASAALSDPAGGYWSQGMPESDGPAAPLQMRPAGGQAADLFFPPLRDETGARMVLRLVFRDRAMTVVDFAGGRCDPALLAPPLPPGQVTAHPGDDLNDLAGRYGTVRLAPGVYALDRPLALERRVSLIGEPGATLQFTQPPSAPAWTAAIKIHAGGTTLEGFAVRFAAPVRWSRDVSYGPAVIGSTDPYDPGGHNDPKAGLVIRRLDIQSPPVAAGAPLEEAPRLMRLVTASCGQIVGNTLKGGVTELANGPWRITDNEYRGTMPGTVAYDTFAGHYVHDMVVARNRLRPTAPCGKTWRFLVMTNRGIADVVRDNRVEGIGMRDDDTIPNPNAPEILLTEAYSLHFEGLPSAINAGGRILQIPAPQGGPARTGDVVSILSDPHAGEWHRIAQALSPTAYLMETPLPAGDYAVSLATGFVGETYAGNIIDCRGSSGTANLVLVGNHYGTRVLNNRLIGGGESIRITAAPTEQPVIWGWSHAPFLGGVIAGNMIEDAAKGGTLSVEHSRYIKSSRGRVYMRVAFRDNTFRWSAPFVARWRAKATAAKAPGNAALPVIVIGDAGSLDPGELALEEAGNRLELPAGVRAPVSARVAAARMNGRLLRDRALPWPLARPRKPQRR